MMTPITARRLLSVLTLLLGLPGLASRAFADDGAGSTPETVILRAVVLPSVGVQLSSLTSLHPTEGAELVAHWNLGSGQGLDLTLVRWENQPPLGSPRERLIPATYGVGSSCMEWRTAYSSGCASMTSLAVIGLTRLSRQRPRTEPLRIGLPGIAHGSEDPASETLEIRIQAI
ncbi:MAG TPA: hypothetical protein VNK82_08645 [Terriglobales bacterium]|nr:hypothetical protein [Terriglobales bacterium]